MTEEELNGLRAGDRVTVFGVVGEKRSFSGVAHINFRDFGKGITTIAVNSEDVHSALPRPLKVGDKVRSTIDACVGEILAIHKGGAWVIFKGSEAPDVCGLCSLERI